MSSDLSQFYQVFYEESIEGLDVMEAELLSLQPGLLDSESINTIFRSAHSIKGGSATFGFNAVAEFTHVVETFLDQIRSGQRELVTAHVDLLLKSVDCTRDLLSAAQNEEEAPTDNADALRKAFEDILDDGVSSSGIETTNDTLSSDEIEQWNVSFIPEQHLFRTGNEPLFMLQELSALGDMSVKVNIDALPVLEELVIDDCYFSWELVIKGAVEQTAIEEIFEWVEDDCKLVLTAVGGISASEVTTETEVTAASEPEKAASPRVTSAASSPSLANAAEPTAEKSAPRKANAESSSIRVSIDKVDSLINMVGELVITQAMLQQLSEGELTESAMIRLSEGLAQLAHNTRDLQESVMQIRMLPISFVFSRFPRLVRDISSKLGKKAELRLQGETTELDKTVMEKISDPIVHLIRNSLDHGLEMPEARVEQGKSEVGIVSLNAFHQGGNIVIEIQDDGRGLNAEKIHEKAIERGIVSEDTALSDDEIYELIFQPGFSTADQVSDLSGRGVGMDVVRRNIQELNGSVEVSSRPGEGSTFTIRLPLTLAILDGQLVTVSGHTYIIPLVNIIESILIDPAQVNHVGGDMEILRQREEYIPILRLNQLFNHGGSDTSLENGLLVIVDSDHGKVGLLVDDLLSQQQVVIKSLEANFQRVEGVSGATILGDGTVSLIVDISGLIKLAGLKRQHRQAQSVEATTELVRG